MSGDWRCRLGWHDYTEWVERRIGLYRGAPLTIFERCCRRCDRFDRTEEWE